MIFQTPILALLLAASLASVIAIWAGGFAIQVLRHWDINSGSRAQLRLERKTELVSTLFRFVLLVEIVALILFVFNADRMAALFVGAMCAVGTFSANAYGFPALYLKITVFFAASLWLILDQVDREGPDFPLTRVKYTALLAVAPLIVVSAGMQLSYFLNLETDVITSCCSKLFTPANDGIAAEMTGLPAKSALWLLGGTGISTALTGAYSLIKGRGQVLFAASGGALFLAALTAIVSVISLYIYDHPHHHCPFCILKPEYGYIGYALYLPLFTGTALALATGGLQALASTGSLAMLCAQKNSKLTKLALLAFGVFGLVSIGIIVQSNLILFP